MKNFTLLTIILSLAAVSFCMDPAKTIPLNDFQEVPSFRDAIPQQVPDKALQGNDIDGNYIMQVLYEEHVKSKSRTEYFEWPGGDPTGDSWIIYLDEALFGSLELESGDEVAIIDKDQGIIVGANTITASPGPGNFQQFVVAFTQLVNGSNGYVAGNEFELQCWKADEQMVSQSFTANFINPFGDAYVPANSDFPQFDRQYSIVLLEFEPVLCPENISVCGSDEPFEIMGGLPEGGEYSGPGVENGITFNPGMAGTGVHIITYSYTNPPTGTEYSCEFEIAVFLPEVTCPEDITVCCDSEPFELTGASPEGGTYYLADEPITIFTPDCGNTGDFEITYMYIDPDSGCENSCSYTIIVNQVPTVSCPDDFAICCDDDAFELTGATPPGGTYFLNDEPVTTFEPDCGNTGDFEIIYLYIDPETGCESSCDFTITVNPLPEVACPEDFAVCCDAEPFELSGATPEGGTYYLDGEPVTTFTPDCAGLGNFEITYEYTDPETSCFGSCSFIITVNSVPEVTCPENISVCCYDEPFELTGATPEGGTYYLDGEPITTFVPDCENAGDHEITYVYQDPTNLCESSCTFTVTVIDTPEVSCPEDILVCCDASPIELTGATPEGGTYFYLGEPITTFVPECGDFGSFEITYLYTDPATGCSSSCSFMIVVNELPELVCPEDISLCCSSEPLLLDMAEPMGGSYSGEGVTMVGEDYYFTPECTNLDDFEITYTYTDDNNCTNSCTFMISVIDPPEVTCPDDFLVCCDAEPVLLTGGMPEGGYYEGPGVSMIGDDYFFTPDCSMTQPQELMYTIEFAGGCSSTCSFFANIAPAPIVNIIPNDTLICADQVMDFSGLVEASDYNTVQWFATIGTGFFDNDNALEPIYYPSLIDVQLGCISLGITVSPNSPCTASYQDFIEICFQAAPTADAGDDASVCDGESYTLLDAAAQNYGSVFWATNGGGTFDNPALVNPTYYPEVSDLPAVVELCLNAIPVNPCELVTTDCLELTIQEFPEVICPEGFEVCCTSEPLLLDMATPAGGVYTGENISVVGEDYYFSPDCASLGEYTVSYIYTISETCGDTCEFNISVIEALPVTCPDDITVCCDADPVELTGATPEGGTYYLNGEPITTFIPECGNSGDFEILYAYINPGSGCESTCAFTITVLPQPELICPADFTICCNDDPLILDMAEPAGGVYSGIGVSLSGDNYIFTPGCDNLGDFEVTYSYTDANNCSNTCSFTISVIEFPEVTCPDDMVVCCDAEPVVLTGGSPEGGVYSGMGVSMIGDEYYFTPDCSMAGPVEITYIYPEPGSCSGSCTFLIELAEEPQVNIIPADTLICDTDVMDFTGLIEASNYNTVQWFATIGTGFFDDDNALEPTYYPSLIDVQLGCISLGVTVSPINPCTASYQDFIEVCFQSAPSADAGDDASICQDENYQVEDANAMNYSTLQWTTSGNGTFDDPSILSPTYFPDVTDFDTTVEICLNAEPIEPCTVAATDCMELSVFGYVEVICPESFEVCCNSGMILLDQALPVGGVYSGEHVMEMGGEYYFTPDCADVGDFVINYTYTVGDDCSSSCEFTITVNEIPEVVCPENLVLCCNEDAVLLSGLATPAGGIFEGEGVVMLGDDYYYDPECDMIGDQMISYTYLSQNNCSNSCEFIITVNPEPEVSITGETGPVCPGTALEYTGPEGLAMYSWEVTGNAIISGATDQQIVNVVAGDNCDESFMLSLTVTDENTCEATDEISVLIQAPELSVVCPDDEMMEPCSTQEEIDMAFEIWIGGFDYAGGCDVTATDLTQYLPPDASGGSVTINYEAMDACNQSAFCTSTFTVSISTELTVTCPIEVEIDPCTSQDEIDQAFENWIEGFSYDGGCDVTATDLSMYAPPATCGGEVTIVYEAMDAFDQFATCTSTFMVMPAPELTATCPADQTIESCSTQDEVDAAFETWIGTFAYDGGCNTTATDLSIFTTPNFCGGNVEITYEVADDCGQMTSCTSTFTVMPAPELTVTCPADQTIESCSTQDEVDAAFATWIGTFAYEGGCNTTATDLSIFTAPNFCGGNVEITYDASDDCGQTASCTSTFTVMPAPELTITCPADQTIEACSTQDEIDAAFETWIGTFAYDGGCNTTATDLSTFTAPNFCGGNVEITYEAADECGQATSCTSTFTVMPAPELTVTCPGDQEMDACSTQDEIDMAFEAWIGGFEYAGGCDVTATDLTQYLPPDASGGSVTINYEAMDACNQSASCTSMFTVSVSTELTVTCPIEVEIDPCTAQDEIALAFEAWIEGFAYDGGCDVTATDLSIYDPPATCGGEVTIVYEAMDAFDQFATCTSTFTVMPAPELTVTCPADQTIESCSTQDEVDAAFETWIGTFAYEGGCNTTATDLSTFTAPNFCGGNVEITYEAADDCGQTASCTSTFTVMPAPELTITCPEDETLNPCLTQDEVDAAFETWIGTFTYEGGCNTTATDLSTFTAPNFCGGNVEITYEAADDCGQMASCTSTFTVMPAPELTITCPEDETLNPCLTQDEVDAAFETWIGTFTYEGGCNTTATDLSTFTAPNFCGGNVEITYEAADDCGQMASCTSTFTVMPAPELTITCPADQTIESCSTQDEVDAAFETWIGTFAYEGGCNTTATDLSTFTAPNFCGGNVEITYEAADDCGQMASCTSTFMVMPATELTITCPADQTIESCSTQDEVDAAFETWIGTFAYEGGCNTTATDLSTFTAPNFCGGNVEITYEAADDCGQMASCTSTFTVMPAPELTITCPADQTIESCSTQDEVDAAFETWISTFAYEGGCNTTATDLSTFTAPNFCGGNVEITYEAADDCGQMASCTSTFMVMPAPELTITCPADQTIESCSTQDEVDAAFETWIGTFTYEGGCNTTATDLSTFTAPNFCGGNVEITYEAADDCGQTASCTSTFTVMPAPELTITCPEDETLNPCLTQDEVDAAFETWIGTFTYEGGCNTTATDLSTFTAPNFCGGNVEITYEAADDCGQMASCTSTFTVMPAPELTITCPEDETLNPCLTQDEVDAAFETWIGTFTYEGGCNTTATDLSTFTAPNFCGGNVEITYEAADDCGQMASCTSTFTVMPAPELTITCPADQTIESCSTQDEVDAAFETWIGTFAYEGGCNTTATDLSTFTAPNFCGGNVEITYEAADDCGQMASCTSTFMVMPAPELTITCSADQTIESCSTQDEVDAAFETWIGNFAYEGGCTTTATDLSTFTAPNFCGGNVEITYEAADDCGQMASCTSTFTVMPAPELTITCPADETIESCSTQDEVDAAFETWIGTFAYEGGCNTTATDLSTFTAPNFCGGNVEITYEAADDCGQMASCTSTFTVMPAPELTITCPADETIESCSTQDEVDAAFETWISTFAYEGGCNTTATDLSTFTAPNFCGGNVEITYEAADDCGQMASCTSTFTVMPAPELTITCPADQTIESCSTQDEVDAAFETWIGTFAYEGGCNTTATDLSTFTAPNFCGGNVEITYEAADDCGQTASCTSTFTVMPAPELTITCPEDETLNPCLTQDEVDAAFETWIGTFTYEGGCNTTATDLSTFTAPNFCGGNVEITYEAADDCGQMASCTSTFTVMPAPELTITCPEDETLNPCLTQDEVDAAFETWIGTFTYEGGCNTTATDLSTFTAPNFCGGNVEITYEAADDCGQMASCTSTFTVMPAPELTITCPADQTIESCSTQDEVDAAFETWIGTFAYEGGCNTTATDLSTFTAPNFCGGNVEITYEAADDCGQMASCTSTFMVMPATELTITCPADETLNPCLTQDEVDAAFETWIGTFTYEGGCNTTATDLSTFTAPNFCGGNVEITYEAADDCGQMASCTSTFTVMPAPELTITCPADQTIESCSTQDEVDAAFETWIGTFAYEGGCNTTATDLSTFTAPNFCGGNVEITYEAADDCGQMASCTSTFMVMPATELTITCPADETLNPCLTQDEVDAAFETWIGTFAYEGGCNTTATDLSTFTAPNFCGGNVEITYEAADDCGQTASCTSNFTVMPAPELTVTCPGDETLNPCLTQDEVDAAFNIWIGEFAFNGGCNTTATDLSGYVAPDAGGGNVSIEYVATDDCNQLASCTSVFSVQGPPVVDIQCPEDFSLCCDAEPLNLSELDVINPPGGIFEGEYVSFDGTSYFFTPVCTDLGEFEMLYTYTEPDFGCEYSCAFNVTISPFPIVYAGVNDSIFNDETYVLANATATDAASLYWSTGGDGTFDDPETLNPTYFPGTLDVEMGMVELCITGVAFEGCDEITSCMTLTLLPTIPEVEPFPSCINLMLERDQAVNRKIRLDNLGFVDLDFEVEVDEAWITEIVPQVGTVPPRSTGFIDLLIDVDDLIIGLYQAEILVTTNDPATPEILFPVSVEIVDNIAGQAMHIPTGWSYLSTYIETGNLPLEEAFAEEIACNTVYFMLDGDGIFWPSQGVNTIGDLSPYSGYKIKMNVDDQLVVFGDPVTDKSIQLYEGPNIVPMLSECDIPSFEIFDQITGQFKYAFDLQEQTVYWPGGGIFTLETLRPGRGYLISMNQDATITYPECDTKTAVIENEMMPVNQALFDVHRTTSHHIISIYADVLAGFEAGNLIAAFNNDGICVGYSKIDNKDENLSLIVFGDDNLTPAVDGMVDGEYIELRLMDSESGIETILDYEFDHALPDNSPVFADGGLSRIVKFHNTTSIGPGLTSVEEMNVKVFPNPAHSAFTILLNVEPDQDGMIQIYNMDGRLMMTQGIDDEQTSVQIKDLPEGVYILNITVNGQVINERIVKH